MAIDFSSFPNLLVHLIREDESVLMNQEKDNLEDIKVRALDKDTCHLQRGKETDHNEHISYLKEQEL